MIEDYIYHVRLKNGQGVWGFGWGKSVMGR